MATKRDATPEPECYIIRPKEDSNWDVFMQQGLRIRDLVASRIPDFPRHVLEDPKELPFTLRSVLLQGFKIRITANAQDEFLVEASSQDRSKRSAPVKADTVDKLAIAVWEAFFRAYDGQLKPTVIDNKITGDPQRDVTLLAQSQARSSLEMIINAVQNPELVANPKILMAQVRAAEMILKFAGVEPALKNDDTVPNQAQNKVEKLLEVAPEELKSRFFAIITDLQDNFNAVNRKLQLAAAQSMEETGDFAE